MHHKEIPKHPDKFLIYSLMIWVFCTVVVLAGIQIGLFINEPANTTVVYTTPTPRPTVPVTIVTPTDSPQVAGWKQFVSSSKKYRIEYPSSWVFRQDKSGNDNYALDFFANRNLEEVHPALLLSDSSLLYGTIEFSHVLRTDITTTAKVSYDNFFDVNNGLWVVGAYQVENPPFMYSKPIEVIIGGKRAMYQTWYRTGSQAGSSPDIYTAEYFIPLSKNSSEEMIINIYYNKTSRSTSENLKTVDQMLSTIQYAQ